MGTFSPLQSAAPPPEVSEKFGSRHGATRAPWAAWVFLAAAIAVTAGIRVWRLNVPLERDEGEYAYAGQLLLQGVPPYKLAYNMKLPGTYAFYAASMAVFGQTIAGVRLGLLLANIATTLLLFVIGTRLLGPAAGAASAAAFAFLSLQTEVLGLFGHATHFVALAAAAGILALLRALESGKRSSFLLAGVLLGCAPLMKQPGAVFALFGVFWLVWSRLADGSPIPRVARDFAWLVAGMAIPLSVTLAALSLSGVLPSFNFWVFAYASKYATSLSLTEGFGLFLRAVARIVPEALLFWGLGALGLAAVVARGRRAERAFFLALLAFSFAGTCAGLYFREHYFILILPAVALLVGTACRALEVMNPWRRISPAVLGFTLVSLAAIQTVWAQRQTLILESSGEAVSRRIYGDDPFPEAIELGRYLRERTGPSDRIAVFGSEPEIYFYARRLSATGYIYMYGLMEEQPFAARMQEEMIREVGATKPAYVVWIKVRTSWLERPRSARRIIEWGADFVRDSYELVGRFELDDAGRSGSWWENDARTRLFDESTKVLIFRRRDFRPVPRGYSP